MHCCLYHGKDGVATQNTDHSFSFASMHMALGLLCYSEPSVQKYCWKALHKLPFASEHLLLVSASCLLPEVAFCPGSYLPPSTYLAIPMIWSQLLAALV